jgi:dGTPase
LKHCSARNAQRLTQLEPNGPAARFLAGTQPSLEAQLVNLADGLAYSAHDVDDGLRAGLITWDQVCQVPLVAHWQAQVLADHPQLAHLPGRRLPTETLRRMLSAQVGDLIQATSDALNSANPPSADAARQLPGLVCLGSDMHTTTQALMRFLFQALYRHPQVTQMTDLAKTVVGDLFAAYVHTPSEMPADYAQAPQLHRAVADYVSGMTDRFALREHHRLTGQRLFAL